MLSSASREAGIQAARSGLAQPARQGPGPARLLVEVLEGLLGCEELGLGRVGALLHRLLGMDDDLAVLVVAPRLAEMDLSLQRHVAALRPGDALLRGGHAAAPVV